MSRRSTMDFFGLKPTNDLRITLTYRPSRYTTYANMVTRLRTILDINGRRKLRREVKRNVRKYHTYYHYSTPKRLKRFKRPRRPRRKALRRPGVDFPAA